MIPYVLHSCKYIFNAGRTAWMHASCIKLVENRPCVCHIATYSNQSSPALFVRSHLRLREIAAASVWIMLVDGAQEQGRRVVRSQETRWRSCHDPRVAELAVTELQRHSNLYSPTHSRRGTQKYIIYIYNFLVWYSHSTSLHHSCCHLL